MDITSEFFQTEIKLKDKKKSKPKQSRSESDSKLCCVICGAEITSNQQQLEIEGSHTHSKKNPANQLFFIRCFMPVENCTVNGEKTSLNSWFSGYQWQFAHCKNCSTQLGWYFTGASSFYGLIEDQLVICNN